MMKIFALLLVLLSSSNAFCELPKATIITQSGLTLEDELASLKLKEQELLKKLEREKVEPKIPTVTILAATALPTNAATILVTATVASTAVATAVPSLAATVAPTNTIPEIITITATSTPTKTAVAYTPSAAPCTQATAPTNVNAAIESQLIKSQAAVKSSNDKLSETKNRLLLAETEVERLSSILESRGLLAVNPNKQRGKIHTEEKTEDNSYEKEPVAEKNIQRGKPLGITSDASHDMPIGSIKNEGTWLYESPASSAKPVQLLKGNDKIAIETRAAGWARVVAPNGVRGWIKGTSIAMGE